MSARGRRPFDDVASMLRETGLPQPLMRHLTTEGDGTVSAEADPEVLETIPGITREAIETIRRRLLAGRPHQSLAELMEDVSPAARTSLEEQGHQLMTLLRFTAPTLVLTAEGWVERSGTAPVATIEIMAGVQPERLAILRRRQW